MAKRSEILACARGELGYCESPAGSNRTKYGAAYGLDGYAWCAMFVWWVFAQCGAEKMLPTKTAGCSALMQAAIRMGSWVTGDYQPGDVVIYTFGHCGIVTGWDRASGLITAIEGNTGSGDDANGGCVMERQRKTDVIRGAVRPPYEPEDSGDSVPDPYAAEAVRWAREKGILLGGADGDLGLRQPCTRQQMCVFLHRALAL